MPLMTSQQMADQFERSRIVATLDYPFHADTIWKLINEPRYQYVRYRGALGRVDYERPDTFYQLGPESPSDCHWMIPQGIRALGQG